MAYFLYIIRFFKDGLGLFSEQLYTVVIELPIQIGLCTLTQRSYAFSKSTYEHTYSSIGIDRFSVK